MRTVPFVLALFITIVFILVFCFTCNAQVAFPGAEGYGKNATGGRGGRAILVDTAQEFQDACEDSSGARNIIFTQGGTYDFTNLGGIVTITNRNLTIAGQTAPGDGVILKNLTLKIVTPNVIVRGIRIGPGDDLVTPNLNPGARDGIQIGSDSCANVIIDHSDVFYGIDENVSVGDSAGQITVQWCYIAYALSNSLHTEGEHSKSLMWHHTARDSVTFAYNVIAHGFDRNAQIVGGGHMEFVDNVLYNYHFGTRVGFPTTNQLIMYLRNWYKPGGDTPNGDSTRVLIDNSAGISDPLIYAEGNRGFRRQSDSGDEWGVTDESDTLRSLVRLANPQITPQDVDSFQTVIDKAGAFPSSTIRTQVKNDIANTTGNIINGTAVKTVYFPFGSITAFSRGVRDTVTIAIPGDAPANRYAGLVFETLAGDGSGQTNTISSSTLNSGTGQTRLIFNTLFGTALCASGCIGGVTTYRIAQTIVSPVSPAGWPTLSAGTAPTDSDSDGLPDTWEVYFGGTTTSISATGDHDGDGYTNLEEYMNMCMDLRIAGLSLEPRYWLK